MPPGAALQYGIAYKPANMGWREAYALPDTEDACQHLSTISAEVLAAKQSKLTALRVADPDPSVTCDRCRVRLPDLWLCMTAGCDHIGCGRRKRGAHALKHAERHAHPIVFKLHSLDMWCYECEKWLGNDGDPAIECLRVKEIAETLAEPAGRTEEEVALFDRRQRERAVSTRVVNSDEFYLVQADWRNLWYDFTMGDRIAPPPSLGDAQVQLAARIERSEPVLLNHDYYVINRQAWEFLAQVYGPAQSLGEHELRNVAVRQILASLRRILPDE